MDFSTVLPPVLFCVPAAFNPQLSWVHAQLLIPRTTAEWLRYIEALETPIFPPSVIPCPPFAETDVPNMWSGRPRAAANLRDWLHVQNRRRWIWRRWLLGIRRRICRKRGNTEDIATLEAIPEAQAIRVLDFRSRATYAFHVSTLTRSFKAALLHQSYGYSEAQMPRNPYTNLPWSLGQICHIVQEIQGHAWAHHRLMDDVLVRFRRAGYSLATFKQANRLFLESRCANLFFGDCHHVGWSDMYRDTLEDIFELLGIRTMLSSVFDVIMKRNLPAHMLATWDAAITEFFIYTNYQRTLRGKTVLEMVQGFRDIFETTRDWWREKFRREHPIVRAQPPKRAVTNRRH